MQTFMPFDDYSSVRYLDMKRLGKQRVEAWQIVQALTGASTGWTSHPATKMWTNHIGALCEYGEETCRAWLGRGYKDSLLERFILVGRRYDKTPPEWMGDPAFHASHRANLLRKNPDFYGQYGWQDDPALPYVWPEPCDCQQESLVIPEPRLIEHRIAFSLAFYESQERALEAARVVMLLGHTYRGGYFDGLLCGRESGFDRKDERGNVSLWAVSMSV